MITKNEFIGIYISFSESKCKSLSNCPYIYELDGIRAFVHLSARQSVGPWARVKKCQNAHFHSCPPFRNWWPCIRPCFFFSSFPIRSSDKLLQHPRSGVFRFFKIWTPVGRNGARPDTRQDSRGRLGRGRYAIIARNSTKFVTDLPTDTARCRVACPRLKIK